MTFTCEQAIHLYNKFLHYDVALMIQYLVRSNTMQTHGVIYNFVMHYSSKFI